MTRGGVRAPDRGAGERWTVPELSDSGVSGTRPATRLARRTTSDGALSSALVQSSTGKVLEVRAGSEGLEEFATALPELMGAPSLARALSVGRLQTATAGYLQDLVLVSPERVHVAQRLPENPELAVVSVARRSASLGWIVSEARATLNRI